MENKELKEFNYKTRRFIASAYKVGISVILIYRFSKESDYDCTITKIHKVLWRFNIFPDNYNCSFDSLIWRRYLINMLEIHESSSLHKFEILP